MWHRHLILAAAALAVAACSDAGPSEPEVGHDAQAYLTEALDVMEYNSVRRRSIDWPAFRAAALRDAEAMRARTPEDTYPAIVEALARLGDGHSFFRPADGEPVHPSSSVVFGGPPSATQAGGLEAQTLQSSGDERRRLDVVEALNANAAYVRIDAFSSGGDDANRFVTRYQAAMRAVGGSEVCGWVVDVRGNGGGNMWPMLASVGPLLGPGPVGYFLYPDGMLAPWVYEDGGAGLDEGAISRTPDPWVPVRDPWVAVLTDSLTASAGEAIAVAFRGRERTRSFGHPTWGVSTGNAAFPLSDGSVIFLTVATMVDRTGTVYGEALIPDELIGQDAASSTASPDPALAAALRWLSDRTCGE